MFKIPVESVLSTHLGFLSEDQGRKGPNGERSFTLKRVEKIRIFYIHHSSDLTYGAEFCLLEKPNEESLIKVA